MCEIKGSSTKLSPAAFEQVMARLDTNQDGKLDQVDVYNLESRRNMFFTNIDTEQKLRELKGLLAQQPDGVIDRTDVLSHQWCRSLQAYAPQDSAKGSQDDKAALQSKLQEMKAEHTRDLQDLERPWKSDELARELVTQHPRLLKHASYKDKVFLMMLLRDAGAGEWAHVGTQDQKAMLQLLASIPQEQRAEFLEAAGGKDLYASLMKGECAKEFQSLLAGSQTSSNQNTSNNASPSGISSGASNANNAGTPASSPSAPPPFVPSQVQDGMSNHHGYRSAMNDLRAASSETERLWKEYSSTTDKERKKELMFELQRAQQWEQQVFQLLSNMLKAEHSIIMGIIRNLP